MTEEFHAWPHPHVLGLHHDAWHFPRRLQEDLVLLPLRLLQVLGVVDLDAPFVRHDKVGVDLLASQRVSLLGSLDKLTHNVRVLVVGPFVEACVPLEEILVRAAAVGRQLHVEPPAHLVEETAVSQVLDFHDVRPLVENGLELTVHVACEDEANAHEFPLCQLLQGVELHLGDLIDHHNGASLWGAARRVVFADVMLEGLAAHEHRCAVSQGRDDVIVVGAQRVELLQDGVDQKGLPDACGTREVQASVLQKELRQVLHQVLELRLRKNVPGVLLELPVLRSRLLVLLVCGHLRDGLHLDVEHGASIGEEVARLQLEFHVLVPRNCQGIDAVHVGADYGDSVVALKLPHGLADAHLLHVQGDASQGRHGVKAHELDAGGEFEGPVAKVPAQLHVLPRVGLVGAAGLLPGILLGRIPQPDQGEDGLFAVLLGPELPVDAMFVVDGLLPALLDELEVLFQELRGNVPTGFQTGHAMLRLDGVDFEHVLHHFGGVPPGTGVRKVALLAGVHEDEIQLRKASCIECLRFVERRKEGQPSAPLCQGEDSARFGVHADELTDAVGYDGLLCGYRSRSGALHQQVHDVFGLHRLHGFLRPFQAALQFLPLVVFEAAGYELLRQIFGGRGSPGNFRGLGAFVQFFP